MTKSTHQPVTDDSQIQSKPGYKHTKLGWLPIDWEVIRLKKVVTRIESGISVNCSDDSLSSQLVLKTSAVTSGKFLPDEVKRPIEIEEKRLSVNVKKNRILICRKNSPGLVGASVFTQSDYPHIYLPDLVWQTVHSDKVEHRPKYIFYALNENSQKYRISNLASGSSESMRNISKEDFLSLQIPLPPLPEQQRIATLLTTWDRAISITQALIKQLKARKRGLMQRLLTGEMRLPGFEGEWQPTRIGKVASEYSKKNKLDEDLTVYSCTKYDGLVPSLEYFGRQVYGSDLCKYKIVPPNGFAYATNHIEEGSIGHLSADETGLVSPMYTVFLTNKNVDDDFLFMVLKSDRMIYQYQSNTSGSVARRGGLRWDVFRSIAIEIPPLDEQQAIARFLITTNQEIDLYRKRLKQLKRQKRGLMQQLLTGQKRLLA